MNHNKLQYEDLDNDPISSNKRLKFKILNVATFLLAMVFNGLSATMMPYSLKEITDEWDTRIDPAGYAFSIWGLIYFLLAIFVVY